MTTITTRTGKGSPLTFEEGDANLNNLNNDKLEKVGGTLTGYKETVYDLGTTGGTISPDVTNGNIQKVTLNSALTINGFSNASAGQSLTLIIYGGTSYTEITSTMLFLGGTKTLTGTAGCIDILNVFYDGTTYFASLGKGFA